MLAILIQLGVSQKENLFLYSSCVALASVRPLASPCTLSNHFKSTICPVLDVVNPTHFSSSLFVFGVLVMLCLSNQLSL